MATQLARRLMPLLDRVVISKADAVSQTKSGILIPEKAQEKVLRGRVVAVGPGSKNSKGETVKPTLKVGDEVLLPQYGGTRFEMKDDEHDAELYIYRESDILAKMMQ